MVFRVGQKVSYPNHGVCKIESVTKKDAAPQLAVAAVAAAAADNHDFYSLRVLANNSLIHVPTANAESVGVRPIINSIECRRLMEFLGEDFSEPEPDWKIRTRDFASEMQTGDIFKTADVLKKLTFIARAKKLSFREQRMFERAKFLVVSELAVVCTQAECQVEEKVENLLAAACERHRAGKSKTASAV